MTMTRRIYRVSVPTATGWDKHTKVTAEGPEVAAVIGLTGTRKFRYDRSERIIVKNLERDEEVLRTTIGEVRDWRDSGQFVAKHRRVGRAIFHGLRGDDRVQAGPATPGQPAAS